MDVVYRKYRFILIFYQFYVVEDAGGCGGRLEAVKLTLSDFDENSAK